MLLTITVLYDYSFRVGCVTTVKKRRDLKNEITAKLMG